MIILCLIALDSWGCSADRAEPVLPGETIDGITTIARTGERYFEIFDGSSWKAVTIKGVNIGTSLPGRWYTEFPADRNLYRTWLEEIAAMNANTIRLYTLLDPAFYAIFAEYNADPANEALWLIQEIWPDDLVPDLNLHHSAYKEAYKLEVDLAINALHGNADIPSRQYRAYGNYAADVSPYLLGILIGRELEPEEVTATNAANPGLNTYNGVYVQTAAGESASPTEVWLAELCDYVMQQSENLYGWQYPVGFVSWPTLDPLTHYTEWEADGTPGYNDREVVNPHIFTKGLQNRAGFFGAYHIYPNYPDFMNNEPSFAEVSDDQGVFRYKGYLNQFMAIHPSYPALVAEFGISTSLNTAHLNPEGLNHGGLTEIDQGEMTVRMMQSIVDEGYAGGIIFEWTDEWAKKTWNTEPFMVPWERQVLWRNAMCPEQNYGIVSVEPAEPAARGSEDLTSAWLAANAMESFNPVEGKGASFGKIRSIETGADEAFFYLAIGIESSSGGDAPWQELGLAVGINMGFRDAGELLLPLSGLPELPQGAEFLLRIISEEEAELLAIPTYNRGLLTFNPEQSRGADFTPIVTLVNRERLTADGSYFPALYANESMLNFGHFNPSNRDYSSTAHWYYEAETGQVIVRLPWMLLNVSDPSAGILLHDSGSYTDLPARDELGSMQTEGLIFYAATYSKENEAVIDFEPRRDNLFDQSVQPFLWNAWEEPQYRYRLKDSYLLIADYFKTVN